MKTILAACSLAGVALVAQQAPIQIDVTGARPLADAVGELEKRFQRAITYEDTRYVHPKDIIDVTDSVSRDPDRSKRIFSMRRGTIRLSVTSRAEAIEDQLSEVLDQVLAAHVKAENAGEFRVLRSGEAFHVVPRAFTGLAGQRQSYTPLLDLRISFPAREESAGEAVGRLAKAVASRAGIHVGLMTMPLNLFAQKRVVGGAADEPARDALWRILQQVSPGLSWRLLCDVGERGTCGLNIHPIPSPYPPPLTPNP